MNNMSNMNSEIFREYDIRGTAKTDLTNEVVENIGKAYGTLIHNNGGKKVAIGKDNRESSPRLFDALVKGITSIGIDVVSIGEALTPELYYAVYTLDVDGGINITGSHNPPEYNGFKILVGKTAIYGSQIQEIREIIDAKKFHKSEETGKITEQNINEKYINEIVSKTKTGRKLKIVVDAGNGMASDLGPILMKKLGCEVIELYCEKITGFPNHIPDPSQEENVIELMKKVVEEKADFGIAFDGDVDRLGVVDEKGVLIFGDQLLGILAADALKRNPKGKVIFEVKCSQGLSEWIEKNNGIPLMWKTGHSLIKAKIKEENALIAGEMSGHMYFAENWYGVDDALVAASRVVEIFSNTTKTVSEAVSEMPYYVVSPEYRVDFSDSEKFDFIKKCQDYFSENYDTITVDGARVNFENGWALIRASNTQQKLIVRMEGTSKDALAEIKEKFLSEIEKFSGKKISL